MNYINLKNKVVIITGSSQGIGKATARLMLQSGAKVVINGRNHLRLAEAWQQLSDYGDVHAISGDMSVWEDVQYLIQSTLSIFGRIDAIVCNAGLKFEDTIWSTTPDTLHKIFHVNFMGQVFPVKAGLEALKLSKGSLIFVSSLAGLYGLPGASIYSASKMALTAINQGLSLELAAEGIHLGIIYVGFTENDPNSGILNGAGEKLPFPDRKLKRQPMEKVGKAIMDMIIYRQRRRVMSRIGLFMDALIRVAPWALRYVLQKNIKPVRSEERIFSNIEFEDVI